MANDPSADHARWLMEQWPAVLATAIESMTEKRPPGVCARHASAVHSPAAIS